MSSPSGSVLPGLFRDQRINAGLSWAGVVLISAVVLAELVLRDVVSAVFGVGVVAVIVVVPVVHRAPRTMLPWEVVALASLPTVGRAFLPGTLAGSIATYLAVAAVALMIAVELHAFTTVSMNYEFALLFVVVTTLAAAGVWAVVRWVIDVYLGTGFIPDNEALMIEFVQATVAGIGAGILFRVYFRPKALAQRVPEETLTIVEEFREEVGGDDADADGGPGGSTDRAEGSR